MSALAMTLTTGRLIIRWRKTRALRSDDILNGLAALLLIPFLVTMFLYTDYPLQKQLYMLGLRQDPPPPVEIPHMLRLHLAFNLVFWCIIYLVKASFLALYWHLFEISTRFRVVWWAATGFTVASFLASVLLFLWHCGSPAKLFDAGKWTSWVARHSNLTVFRCMQYATRKVWHDRVIHLVRIKRNRRSRA